MSGSHDIHGLLSLERRGRVKGNKGDIQYPGAQHHRGFNKARLGLGKGNSRVITSFR